MKCIKTTKQFGRYALGHMLRVSDKDANQRVSTGYWTFIPKSEFKGSTGEKEVIHEEDTKKKKSKEVEKKSYGRKKTK
jgi:hypothetical protein